MSREELEDALLGQEIKETTEPGADPLDAIVDDMSKEELKTALLGEEVEESNLP